MAILKLKAAGDTATLHIVKCEVVEGSFGEQVKFTAANGDQLFLPRDSADRQLARQGFADGEAVLYSDVDGTTLVFSRDPNKKPGAAPYWSITRVVPSDDLAHRPSLKEAAQAEAERVRKAKGLPPEEDGNLGPHIPGLDDAPPPSDEDYPYDDDGLPPVKASQKHPSSLTAEQVDKEGAINAAYARAYAFVLGVQGAAATADSVQAGTATLVIQYSRAGIC